MSHIFVGDYSPAKGGHTAHYFAERYTFMDFRGDLKISPQSQWGYRNRVITMSHDIRGGSFTPPIYPVKVHVDEFAWITSFCTLYDCHICHHAIVSIGSVVNGIEVEPFTIVAGNPAVVVSRWDGEKWIKV